MRLGKKKVVPFKKMRLRKKNRIEEKPKKKSLIVQSKEMTLIEAQNLIGEMGRGIVSDRFRCYLALLKYGRINDGTKRIAESLKKQLGINGREF